MSDRYPPIEPYGCSMLDVGDGHLFYQEVSGRPDGKPVLVVHGGSSTWKPTGSWCSTSVGRDTAARSPVSPTPT